MTKAWAAVAVGLLLFSCAKEKGPNENPPVVTLGVSTEELNFTAEEDAPAQTVEVTSNALWQAAVDDTWLEIDKEKGYQNGTITVSIVEGNGSTEARTATLTIVAGKLVKEVMITQAAGGPALEIVASPEEAFDGDGGQDVFTLSSNLEWTATSDADWLTILGFEDAIDEETEGVASFDGEGSGKVVIVVAANDTYVERTATITVTSGDLSDSFIVTQAAKVDRMAVEPASISVPVAGGAFEVAVDSNSDWNVEIPLAAEWCEVDKASGSGSDVVTFTLTANESGVPRTAEVKISVSAEVFATVTFSQGRVMSAAVRKDSLALISIYNAADGANWTEQHRWDLSTPIYEWKNVKTDPATGRVTSISLTDNGLIGTEWELPSAIGDLTELTVLKINNQKLQGAIPSVVYTLTSLEQLYFTGNNLTGEISSNIGNLTKLKNLYVDKNANLDGTIPATIGQLTELNYINISQTGVGGAIPSELTNCSKLNAFMAFKSALTSIDIAWDTFTHLQTIQAYGCPGLTGTLPACLGSVVTDKSIFTIQLYDCNFTGNVPDNWANLTTKCTQVYINGNKLSGELPVAFYQHANYAAKWNAAQRILPQQEGFGLTEPVPNND